MNSHVLDYHIYGDDIQYVEIGLDPRETVIAEAGAMMMMTEGIQMETIFGDGSSQGGNSFADKLFGAGKRVLTGESLFMTAFTNTSYVKQQVSFAAPYPGKIIPMDLSLMSGKLICQKDAFLCAAKGVSIGIDFRKKLSVGFFGGEGFILEKLEGEGLAFIHACGAICKKELAPGERLKVDTGCLIAMNRDVHYDIEMVRGVKNALFGGEGLFLATLTGPGIVWLQSLPFNRLAGKILSVGGARGTGRREESGLLGGRGNLFD